MLSSSSTQIVEQATIDCDKTRTNHGHQKWLSNQKISHPKAMLLATTDDSDGDLSGAGI